MPKLIITADVHGNYDTWLTLKSLLGKYDSLAVAGDLFDTRYGSFANASYDPQAIKNDLNTFSNPFYYVYGNCDIPSFFPGFSDALTFEHASTTLFMNHGHRPIAWNTSASIVVQGHTHVAVLEKKSDRIFMNPGSLAAPRNGVFTYGVLTDNTLSLIELTSGRTLVRIDL